MVTESYDVIPDPDSERVHIEYRGDFAHVSRGRRRWCFSTTRPLEFNDQRTFDALVRIHHEQSGL